MTKNTRMFLGISGLAFGFLSMLALVTSIYQRVSDTPEGFRNWAYLALALSLTSGLFLHLAEDK